MGRLDHEKIKTVLHQLEKAKIFDIGELASLLTCSVPNARLKLKQWQAFTSYNQNGKYYTLPQVPRFDGHGLWRYKNAAFSRHGNLKNTVIHLVSVAPAGLSGKQLGEILGLSPQSFLHHFRQCPGIHREKHDGVYIYFSDVDEVYEKQLQERTSVTARSAIEAKVISRTLAKGHPERKDRRHRKMNKFEKNFSWICQGVKTIDDGANLS
jgi:hypothetical protein